MRRRFKFLILLLLFMVTLKWVHGQNAKVDYRNWDGILKEYVAPDGSVDYSSLNQKRETLDRFLDLLSQEIPGRGWSQNEQLAYWINVYNAFTIKLILDHYPVKSIRDIDQPWDRKFIRLGGKEYSLNQIEHEIIRKEFKESRIHFALVCAAVSCPPLLNEAYVPDNLDEQLERQGKRFINNPVKNKIEKTKVRISQIFNWFQEDFTQDGPLIAYLNRFSETKINPEAKVAFMEYDWGLNGE